MSFYKLESTYRFSGKRKDRTYKYFLSDFECLDVRFRQELYNKATVKVKEITEHEYIKGTRI